MGKHTNVNLKGFWEEKIIGFKKTKNKTVTTNVLRVVKAEGIEEVANKGAREGGKNVNVRKDGINWNE